MSYVLALILAAVAAALGAVARSSRTDPRHEFIFEMLARMAPGGVVAGFAREPFPAAAQKRAA